MGIQTKTARIRFLSKTPADTQAPRPDMSQHQREAKAFQNFPTTSAGEEVTSHRTSWPKPEVMLERSASLIPTQHPPQSCLQ